MPIHTRVHRSTARLQRWGWWSSVLCGGPCAHTLSPLLSVSRLAFLCKFPVFTSVLSFTLLTCDVSSSPLLPYFGPVTSSLVSVSSRHRSVRFAELKGFSSEACVSVNEAHRMDGIFAPRRPVWKRRAQVPQ